MLTLITAPPGSGKSQYAIEVFVLDFIKANEADIADWAKNKARQELPPPLRRQVYTNIKGMLRADRVAKITALVGGLPLLASPDDWRTCPDGSIVIYDEAQQKHLFRATGKPGAPDDERMTDLDTHRHRGFDIVLITQEVGLIHHWAKKFIGRHVDLERVAGAEMMTVREWGSYQASPSDYHTKQAADTSVKRMHPATWELYDSATVHTHKFIMPSGAKWAIRGFLFLALMIPLGFFGVGQWANARSSGDAEASNPTAQSLPTAERVLAEVQEAVEVPVALVVAESINGCALGRFCRCWNDSGDLLVMDDARCRNLAVGNEPMPIDLNRFAGSREGSERGAQGEEREASPAPRSPAGVTTMPTSVGSISQGDMQGNPPNGSGEAG